MWLHELADADADPATGGKAAGLARLIAAGLPVPPGFAIDDGAFHAIAQLDAAAVGDVATVGHALAAAAARLETAPLPPELERAVLERAAALGPRVVVRSSAAIEDRAASTAAGVFASVRDVPSADVWVAVRAVWTSALAPLAVAYAQRSAAPIRVGVIVQAFAPGELVTVYTRPPGEAHAPELLVQRGGELVRELRAEPGALGRLALRAEAAIGADGGADVELAGDAIVQARPIAHPSRPAPRVPPPPIALAPLADLGELRDGRVWTWDVAHNPDPLSPAQTGLVELVERAQLGAYALRVCGGYLYATPRGASPQPPARDLAAAEAHFGELDALLAAPPASIDDALARYAACYAIWAELASVVAAARHAITRSAHRASSIEVALACAARGELAFETVIARFGDLAPAWDVAVPSFGETPQRVRDAIACAASNARGAAATPPPTSDVTAEPDVTALAADRAADLAERDDLYFAHMQQLVRRALLARAAELGLVGDDIFWLSLDDARTAIDRDIAHRRATAARAAHARASAWDMPLTIGGEPSPPGRSLHGVGSGPRVTGRAVRFATLAAAAFVAAGDVVVVRAVTPALAMFVGRCAAIVSETGGLLDHGAALARELGITYVVGCQDAWSTLADGMLVTVDGDAGEVYSSSS